jgi:Raf kinase inhibitor-like YbhB/YbcL family protein
MQLTSPAFEHEGTIPTKYTCDGENISPPLAIEGVPAETRCLVLLVDDPDAPGGTFDHWVLYDIPSYTKAIDENTVPGTAGRNSYKKNAYGGPCPPSGRHRYFFKLYALDRLTGFEPGRSKEDVEKKMAGHILAQAELMGVYQRG